MDNLRFIRQKEKMNNYDFISPIASQYFNCQPTIAHSTTFGDDFWPCKCIEGKKFSIGDRHKIVEVEFSINGNVRNVSYIGAMSKTEFEWLNTKRSIYNWRITREYEDILLTPATVQTIVDERLKYGVE